ncbi:hypothetical protein SAMN05660748_0692 [Blastococcus aggregatus]|uniref:Uncharacterized protein n=1 Tax=Blastococcus aggregatus TaxID=38502 RepID=A0A285V2I0_9ACTN|nr:hypothetical protein [Blastococcus aggregatus]SOC47216.1 hypothetical protein SAMN05660748_0692 [Blastococcus aggregatus]
MVDIRCDVQQGDERGYVWTLLDEAHDPSVIVPGAIVITGNEEEPVFAQVIDIVGYGATRRVHLHIAPGTPDLYLRAAARAHLIATDPLDASISEAARTIRFGEVLAARGVTTVALDEHGKLRRYPPNGTTSGTTSPLQ